MNQQLKTVLEQLVEPFIEKLGEMTIIYKLIGSERENPMWLQLNPIRRGEIVNELKFTSSACDHIWLSIPIDETTCKYMWSSSAHTDAYDFFKHIKYKHLIENHSTVATQTGVYNLERVRSFMNNYSLEQLA